MCSRALNRLFSTLLIRIRSPTLLSKKFLREFSDVLRAEREADAQSTAITSWAKSRAGLSLHEWAMLVSLNTFNRFVTLLEIWH